MAVQDKLHHPQSTGSVSTIPPKERLKSPWHAVKPRLRVAIRSTVKPSHPQIGDRARLWDYVESEWIEGEIESIQLGYRILVRCVDRLEETLGWYLAFRDGAWVEDIVGVTGTKS
jgi:hypothetical protein